MMPNPNTGRLIKLTTDHGIEGKDPVVGAEFRQLHKVKILSAVSVVRAGVHDFMFHHRSNRLVDIDDSSDESADSRHYNIISDRFTLAG